MNYVPHRFRNVINPWQTPKDIQSAVMFILKMMKDREYDDWEWTFNTFNDRGPDRVW